MPLLNIRLLPGKKLFDPLTGVLMTIGKVYRVPNNPFWRKRLKDKDVEKASGSPKGLLKDKGDSESKDSKSKDLQSKRGDE